MKSTLSRHTAEDGMYVTQNHSHVFRHHFTLFTRVCIHMQNDLVLHDAVVETEAIRRRWQCPTRKDDMVHVGIVGVCEQRYLFTLTL